MLESRDNLFTDNDELSFKQQYVIAFMAARASDKYESAWDRWCEVILQYPRDVC